MLTKSAHLGKVTYKGLPFSARRPRSTGRVPSARKSSEDTPGAMASTSTARVFKFTAGDTTRRVTFTAAPITMDELKITELFPGALRLALSAEGKVVPSPDASGNISPHTRASDDLRRDNASSHPPAPPRESPRPAARRCASPPLAAPPLPRFAAADVAADGYKLSYVDEDGDTIALVSAADLAELNSQNLAPARITVTAKSLKPATPAAPPAAATPASQPGATDPSGRGRMSAALRRVVSGLTAAGVNTSLVAPLLGAASTERLAALMEAFLPRLAEARLFPLSFFPFP